MLKTLICTIKRLKQKRKHSSSQYYLLNKNHLPPWIFVNDLSFGQVIQWYKILPSILKTKVVDELISDKVSFNKEKTEYLLVCQLTDNEKKEFASKALALLSDYRNLFAHGDRAYPQRITVQLPKKALFKMLPHGCLSEEEYNRGLGREDFLALIFSIVFFTIDGYVPILMRHDLGSVLKNYASILSKSRRNIDFNTVYTSVLKYTSMVPDFKDRIDTLIKHKYQIDFD